MVTDTIGDCLTRLRNAGMAGHSEFKVPHSKMKESVLKLLREEGFLESVEVEGVEGSTVKKQIVAKVRYRRDGEPVFKHLRRVSTPGQRVYRSAPTKLEVRSGYGFQLLSTSKGIMTDRQAIEQKIGGEILAEAW